MTSFKPPPSDGEQWCSGFELFPNCLHLQPSQLLSVLELQLCFVLMKHFLR